MEEIDAGVRAGPAHDVLCLLDPSRAEMRAPLVSIVDRSRGY